MAATVKKEFDPKNMPFRRLGRSGLRVPLFSLGGWLTLGGTVTGDPVKDIIRTAFDAGINMFDTAEAYAGGNSEIEMGRVIKELGLRRTDLIISTKLFWGPRSGPNDQGLSRKHIIEGAKECLERLQLDYVDVIFAHRADRTVPMEEVVRAFNYLLNKGQALYWATSEWSAREIEEAHHIAEKLHLAPPIADQSRHNMFHRRIESEYAPVYAKYGTGITAFSALAGGILTGKYNNEVPANSRFDTLKDVFKKALEKMASEEGKKQVETMTKLAAFAEKELNCKLAHLALAWIAANPNTSTVILGASHPDQVTDNLKALEVLPKLTPQILEEIEGILNNKPTPEELHGR